MCPRAIAQVSCRLFTVVSPHILLDLLARFERCQNSPPFANQPVSLINTPRCMDEKRLNEPLQEISLWAKTVTNTTEKQVNGGGIYIHSKWEVKMAKKKIPLMAFCRIAFGEG
jgi:hypothetical protein